MYPEAQMVKPMKIWKLPAGKEDKFSDLCESGAYFAQVKVDGAFYQFERTENYCYLFSRVESRVTGFLTEKSANVPHIIDALKVIPAGTTLIGEIYVPGGTSKDVTSIMGCLPEKAIDRQKGKPIHYYVYDIIRYNGESLIDISAEKRYNILKEMWESYELEQYPFLTLASIHYDNIGELLSVVLAQGGEGIVLKRKDASYTPDKRPAWSTVKVKQMDTIDLVCVGLLDATQEYTGKDPDNWPYWLEINGELRPVSKPYYFGWKTAIEIGAYDDVGNLKVLGTASSGLTDEQKADMSENPSNYIGKVVALRCMSIDKKACTLRHPVVVEFREDKTAQDCIISEIFS